MGTPVIEMKGITKRFGSLTANNRVDFTLEKGSIHALLGENGAGKSTLMNILTGLYHPDEGEIFVRGEKRSINSPRDAYALGIGMVHQHFMLIPKLTVAENIVLGLKTGKSPLLDLSEVVERVKHLSDTYRIQVDPHALVGDLTVGQQQRVEIMKLLYRDADILILDEPTAVLTPQEAESLCTILRSMAQDGFSIILITHKLDEALSVCSRIDVLRDASLIDSVPVEKVNRHSLANMMVGRDVVFQYDCEEVEKGDVVLRAENIVVGSASGKAVLQNISLSLRQGEILGVAGVSGNGQSDLAKALAGIRRIDGGKVFLEGKDVSNSSVESLTRRGISYIPDDRHLLGMFPELKIKENLLVKEHNRRPYSRFGLQNRPSIDSHAREIVEAYNIKTPSIELPMKSLSGGNQQKVVLAREFSLKPKIIIADQPTRGLDVGAIEYIHKMLLQGKSSGLAILLISTELEEILNLSDRIIVMYEGRISLECDARCVDLERLGLAMAGEITQ